MTIRPSMMATYHFGVPSELILTGVRFAPEELDTWVAELWVIFDFGIRDLL